ERGVTVDVRLAFAQQIQVGAVQNQNRRHDFLDPRQVAAVNAKDNGTRWRARPRNDAKGSAVRLRTQNFAIGTASTFAKSELGDAFQFCLEQGHDGWIVRSGELLVDRFDLVAHAGDFGGRDGVV